MDYQTFIKAFEIFAKYDHLKTVVYGEFDVLYAGPDPESITDEDYYKVIELGWMPDEEENCFYIFTESK